MFKITRDPHDIPKIPKWVKVPECLKASVASKVAGMQKRSFNLPPIVTCPGRTPKPDGCAAHCYACKGRMCLDMAMKVYWENLAFLVDCQKGPKASGFARAVGNLELILPKSGIFRIHSGGDFYNQWYLDVWDLVIHRNPHIKFCAHIKSFHLNWDVANRARNFYPRASRDPQNKNEAKAFARKYNTPISYGHWPHDSGLPMGAKVCPLTQKVFKELNPDFTCMDCMYCWSRDVNNDVVFLKH